MAVKIKIKMRKKIREKRMAIKMIMLNRKRVTKDLEKITKANKVVLHKQ
jgi:hypothetical protein